MRPLRRRTVGKRLGRDVTSGHALKAIVTDRRRGTKAGCDIRPIYDVALLSGMAPDSREAIGLQFEAY
jgi:hypothetical protein